MLEDGMTSCCLGIGVQFKHNPQVLQRILLQHSAINLLAVMTTLCSVNNVDMPCQIQTQYEKLLLRTSKIIRIQKHGPEVEYHHCWSSKTEFWEWAELTLVHGVLSGSPRSSGSCSDLCWSSCAWAGWNEPLKLVFIEETTQQFSPTDSSCLTQNFNSYHKISKTRTMKLKLITETMISLFTAVTPWLIDYLLVANLQGGRFAPGAVQLIQLAERTLCPDAETSNMSSRSKSQEVQFVYVQKSNSCWGKNVIATFLNK